MGVGGPSLPGSSSGVCVSCSFLFKTEGGAGPPLPGLGGVPPGAAHPADTLDPAGSEPEAE